MFEFLIRGHTELSVHSDSHRLAWIRVHHCLERAVDRVANDSDWRYDVVRLRNVTALSNNGAFDGIRQYLLEQTMTLLGISDSWANPPYFVILTNPVYAHACLDEYAIPHRRLITECVDAFLLTSPNA